MAGSDRVGIDRLLAAVGRQQHLGFPKSFGRLFSARRSLFSKPFSAGAETESASNVAQATGPLTRSASPLSEANSFIRVLCHVALEPQRDQSHSKQASEMSGTSDGGLPKSDKSGCSACCSRDEKPFQCVLRERVSESTMAHAATKTRK